MRNGMLQSTSWYLCLWCTQRTLPYDCRLTSNVLEAFCPAGSFQVTTRKTCFGHNICVRARLSFAPCNPSRALLCCSSACCFLFGSDLQAMLRQSGFSHSNISKQSYHLPPYLATACPATLAERRSLIGLQIMPAAF